MGEPKTFSKNQIAGMDLAELQEMLEAKKAELPYGYKLPYMQWYEDDFKSSDGVAELSPLGRLMYRQLLAKAWVSKSSPYLPNDSKKLKRLADCPTDEDWSECELEIKEMFQTTDDSLYLFHPRQLTNYITQIIKIASSIGNGTKGGRPKKPNKTPRFPEPLSEEPRGFVSERQLELDPELKPKQDLEQELNPAESEEEQDGQEMKAEKEIVRLCQTLLNVSAKVWDSDKKEIKRLESIHKGSAVARAFEEWAAGLDEAPTNPVSAFLRAADGILSGESTPQKAMKASNVKDLFRELAYLSDARVTFGAQHALGLEDALSRYSQSEICAVFKTWLEDQDLSDQKNLAFAAKNFTERADALCYTARKKKQERVVAESERELAKARLQAEAEAERLAAESTKNSEELLDNPLEM